MAYYIGVLMLQVLTLVHVVRAGKTNPWLYVVMLLPMVGTIAYFVAEVLPELLGGGQARSAVEVIQEKLDPERRLRSAAENATFVDTPRAKIVLAEECVRLGRYIEAADHYRSAMTGLFKDDPALNFSLSQALADAAELDRSVWNQARSASDALRAIDATYRRNDQDLIKARIASGLGDAALAERLYLELIGRNAGPEAKVRLARLFYEQNRKPEALRILSAMAAEAKKLPRHARQLNAQWHEEADRAIRSMSRES
jgi:hypothetical protein